MPEIQHEINNLELRLAQLRAAQAAIEAVPREGPGLDDRWKGRDSFSLTEVAEILGIAPATAYTAAQKGQIPTIRIGRILRVGRRALEKLLGD